MNTLRCYFKLDNKLVVEDVSAYGIVIGDAIKVIQDTYNVQRVMVTIK